MNPLSSSESSLGLSCKTRNLGILVQFFKVEGVQVHSLRCTPWVHFGSSFGLQPQLLSIHWILPWSSTSTLLVVALCWLRLDRFRGRNFLQNWRWWRCVVPLFLRCLWLKWDMLFFVNTYLWFFCSCACCKHGCLSDFLLGSSCVPLV